MFFRSFSRYSQVQLSKKTFSIFSHVKARPSDPILGLVEEFKKDKASPKVNLSAGTYKDDNGNPYILNCIKAAQKIILDKNLDHEYLPIDGLKGFIDGSLNLAYTNIPQIKQGKVAALQTLSGTGALRVGFEFLKEHYIGSDKPVLIPNPSWPNHKNVIIRSGLNVKEYRYYDYKNKKLDLNGLLEDLDKAPKNSIVLLHVCAHNPTGMDPTQSEWEEIYKVVKSNNHLAFFDMAYQGFSSGDLDKDAYSLRRFVEGDAKIALAQSFAKNFGLYGQRVGCFSIFTGSSAETEAVSSHLKFVARAQYSSPPKYGANIVDIVLSDPALTQEWHRELKVMSGRIADMRQALYDNLKAVGSTQNWDHIVRQIGMFAYTGLNLEQCKRLKSEFHIYLTDDGRISISGLNTKNVEIVAKAFHAVTKV